MRFTKAILIVLGVVAIHAQGPRGGDRGGRPNGGGFPGGFPGNGGNRPPFGGDRPPSNGGFPGNGGNRPPSNGGFPPRGPIFPPQPQPPVIVRPQPPVIIRPQPPVIIRPLPPVIVRPFPPIFPPRRPIRVSCTRRQRRVRFCTRQYRPVCGYRPGYRNRYVTYANDCQACRDSRVTSWTIGRC